MSKEKHDRDVEIVVYPKEKKVVVEYYNTADVMVKIQNMTGSVNDPAIPENKVNEFLNWVREQKLSYSFKIANDPVEELVIGD